MKPNDQHSPAAASDPVPRLAISNRISKAVKLSLCLSIAAMITFLMGSDACRAKEADVPTPVALVLQKSYLLIEEKKIDAAIDFLNDFREKGKNKRPAGEPDKIGDTHYLIDFTLANCYQMSNQLASALPLYESAVKKQPDFSPAWINLGRCYYEQSRFDPAADAFINAYETSEDKKADFLYYAAVASMAGNRNKKALAIFDRLLNDHRGDVTLEWKESLVQAYLTEDLPRKALPFIEELAEKTTEAKRRQWQEVLLYQYVNLGMKNRALAYARQLTREYPVDPKWWKALAHLHLSENRYESGLVALTVYGLLTPLTDEEKKLMAELSAAAGVPVQAARFYEDVLSKTMDPSLVKRIAETYRILNRKQEALKWVEKGLRHTREEDLLMMKGHLLYEMKAYREAMEVFKSIPEGEHSGQAYLMMGYAALNAEDFDRARDALKQASRYSKQKKTAMELLEQLNKMVDQARS